MLPHRWSVRIDHEWVTAIAPLDLQGTNFAVTTRSGLLVLFDEHGNQLCQHSMNSWTGALRAVTIADNRTLLIAGNKHGEIRLLEVKELDEATWTIRPLSEMAAANAVRSISIGHWGGRSAAVVGSQDRHIYFFDVERAAVEGIEKAAKSVEFNGWIRAVDYCFPSRATGVPLIAAGCGDKRVYFVDQDSQQKVAEVNCRSKVHYLLTSRDGAKLFATSDSRTLFEITYPRRMGNAIISREIQLPARASLLAFADSEENQVLVCSENGRIYVYDTAVGRLVGSVTSPRPIFSIASLPHRRGGGILLGQDHGTVTFAALPRQQDVDDPAALVRQSMPPRDVLGVDRSASATALVRGSTGLGVQVGIGRFLNLDESGEGTVQAFVATDEGEIAALGMTGESEINKIWSQEPRPDVRVWSVSVRPASPNKLWIFASTSDGTVEILEWTRDAERPVHKLSVTCPDWPREIRWDRKASGIATILAGCESGHVISIDAHGTQSTVFEGAGIIRTICVGGGNRVVVGTDGREFALYDNGVLKWRIQCLDSVREVIEIENVIVAVSEDHFVYAVSLTGVTVWRCRLPHRVLCVERVGDVLAEEWAIAVGCSDGQLYLIDSKGMLLEGIEFPDRIRDVVSTPLNSLLVTSEDGFVYPALLRNTQGESVERGLRERIQSFVDELRTSVDERGYSALDILTVEVVLVLLEYYDLWRGPVDDDLVLACVDRVLEPLTTDRNIALPYRLATVLVSLMFDAGQPAAFRRRLQRLIESSSNGSPYPAHAVVRSLIAADVATTIKRDILHGFLSLFTLSDDWLVDELVRALSDIDYFSITSNGFTAVPGTVRIRYSLFSDLLSLYAKYSASGRAPADEFSALELWRLATNRSGPSAAKTRDFLAGIRARDRSPVFEHARSLLAIAVESPPLPEARFDDLRGRWLTAVGPTPLAKSLDAAFDRMKGFGMARWEHTGVAAEFLEEEVRRSDPELTGAEYAYLLTLLAIFAALSTL